MWRRLFVAVGGFLKGTLTMQVLLAVYGVAGSGYIVVNIFIGENKAGQSPFQNALNIFYTSIWLLVFFVITYLFVQVLGEVFIRLGNYYPKWFYFPKLNLSCNLTTDNEIELRVVNLKFWQNITLRAECNSVYEAESRPTVRGVAPSDLKELLPLAPITGRDARIKIIGRVIDGGMILSIGNKNEEVKFTQPGFYYYEISVSGKYKGGNIRGMQKFQ